ncbi:hypothetical protein N790_10095 [Arenimonas malthae CC-JY-1]|uniref:Uncharacterized protein n=1 Tax=Arenimonas malthae CC-JY-1 TaxID=1384054 RepID=A0A091B379_9GAMM|nr:hypothetical protein [Arenimonas malthae]KFN45324.1 hypothetical protein N790_10095 [Arenimonas malthae CC-JY-1]
MKPLAAIAATLLLAAAVTPAPALANPLVEATQTCFSDSTTGKDRKLLGKWIFLALAGHPEISQLSSASAADHEDTSRQFAALFMRLVTVDCASEMRALAQAGGPEAMKLPFEHLGQIAMQELMNHPNVSGNIAGFERFLDQDKLNATLTP